MIKEGTYLFAGWERGTLENGRSHMDAAKDYIKENGHTQEDVKLIRRWDDKFNEYAIYVIAKRDLP